MVDLVSAAVTSLLVVVLAAAGQRRSALRPGRGKYVRSALVVTLAVVPILLWLNSTETLDLAYSGEAVGREVTITHGELCSPNLPLLYRPVAFGRWQRTHVASATDVSHWWVVTGPDLISPAPCETGGTLNFTLPDDAGTGDLAVCGFSSGCALVTAAANGR